ncbi:SDR family oxidoreductase [Cellulosimicrobium marinum]|uniref:SDR family oxidoreductase n=1 Tax=Cellulosimicrobium marinum TaxID=1638992 RepID=UPI001E4E0E96|nr:SDR family oxidoreductase [Cellulosimicrobium marinum]MCB7135740.1 SDR family oxidoreductase [Cellulosimicrobium marinum]
MRIAVAGATGTVGTHVVDVARERGHEVVPLTRSTGVDLTTGAGLPERLDGVDAVIDVANVTTQKRAESEAFFGAVTRSLLAAERDAGVGHHVALSIIGIDDVPSGYYDGKRLQERLLAESDRPWSVLRAAQFHEFAQQALGFMTIGPFSLVPLMHSQPVAAREVAEALVALAERGPSGRVADLAGPEVLRMHDAARRLSRARGLGRRVVPVPLPGVAGRGLRDGSLTAAGDPGATLASTTFDRWLESAPTG